MDVYLTLFRVCFLAPCEFLEKSRNHGCYLKGWHILQMANSQFSTATNPTQWSPKWKFTSRNDSSKSILKVKRGKMDLLKLVMDTREPFLVQIWPWVSKKKMTVSEILIKPGLDGRACSKSNNYVAVCDSQICHIYICGVSSLSEVGTLKHENDFQIYHWTIKFKLFLKSLMAWALELTRISLLLVIIADSSTLNKVLMWLRPVFNVIILYSLFKCKICLKTS